MTIVANRMSRLLTLSLTVASFLEISSSNGQSIGNERSMDIEPTEKSYYYRDPFVGSTHIYRIAELENKKGKPLAVAYAYPLTDQGPPIAKLIDRPNIEGEVENGPFFFFNDHPWGIFQSWKKESGSLSLFAQKFGATSLAPEGDPIGIGEVPLDPKSYKGTPLYVRTLVSPDSSKLLFYFDEIQSQGIKLAMCWVVDEEIRPIWSGMYKIPVQAYGAKSSVNFFDDGQVTLSIEAIVLNDANTREKSDGSEAAKVDKSYLNETSSTVYVMHDKTFRMWDGALSGGKASIMQLMNIDGEWRFLAFRRSGKGKDANTEWVFGTMDNDLHPTEVSKGKAVSTLAQILLNRSSSFLFSCYTEDATQVGCVNANGALEWEHVAPLRTFPELKVIEGRLVGYFEGSEETLDDLLAGKSANADLNVGYTMLPIVLIWQNGQRQLFPLIPKGTKYKDKPDRVFFEGSGKWGVPVHGYRQNEASITLIPISW
jgi:hypothetical protein